MNKLHIVLYQPEIHANTGNISRTCAITGADLHLIRPLGFSTDDRHLRRAGLDYWDKLNITYYDNVEDFYQKNPDAHIYYFTTKGRARHVDVCYEGEVYLMFGKETAGLPRELILANPETSVRIPMLENRRCLNLSKSNFLNRQLGNLSSLCNRMKCSF
jgi:tRNA (cytidine/uridine-2'-O-)-methyltransferase